MARAGGAQAGRPVRRGEERAAQRLDGGVGLRDGPIVLARQLFGLGSPSREGDLGAQPGGERAAGRDRRRRAAGPRVGVGHSSATASSAAPEAIAQPASRSGIERRGPGSDTGRMKASSSEVVAPASTELTTPANSTAKRDDRHRDAPTATTLCETSVPSEDEHSADERERALRQQPLAHRPAEVDEQQHRERAERRERRQRGIADHLVADREHRRHDDRRPPGATQRGEVAIAFAEPLQWMHVCRRPECRDVPEPAC